jgi:hypothetical protein
MFKLNLKKGWQETLSTIKRFPLAYAAAVIVTACFLVYSQLSFDSYILADENEWLIKIAFTGIFGFFLFYALHLVAETKKFKKKKFWLGAGLITLALALIYFFQYQYFEWRLGEIKTAVRTAGTFVVAYLLAMSAAFYGFKTKENAFWQYVLRMSIRIVQAFVVFGVLFGGVAALLGTISFLFEANISAVVYSHVFIVLAGLGATSYVMRGVDQNVSALDKVKTYPKFIETVVHYVLIPLVYVYAAVVLVYLIQALAIFEWPRYGTTELLAAFLLVGLSAFMLTYPHSGKKDWGGFYHKYFFVFALVIATAMLVGIGVRIQEFGFTVNRYIVAMLGIFMIALACWKFITKKLDIRNVYYAAIVFMLIAMFGPISAFSATWISQTSRLETAMTNEDASRQEVTSIVRVLSDVAYAPRIESYLNDITQNNEFKIDENTNSYEIAEQFAGVIGIERDEFSMLDSGDKYMNSDFFSVSVSQPIQQVELGEYNYFLRFDYYPYSNQQPYVIGDQKFELTREGSTIKLGDYFERDLTDFFNLFAGKQYHSLPAKDIEIRDEDYVIQFEYIDGITVEDGVEIDSMSGYILLK